MTQRKEFDQFHSALESGGAEQALALLAEQLRSEKKFHELFEALKMQVRHRLGLPLLYGDLGDDLGDEQRDALEQGLIDACREVGLSLLRDGRIREGWMYLRPVGDQQAAAEILGEIEADDNNLDELVEVALSEGVDVELGYQLVLDHYGTCNAITTFESEVRQRSREQQQAIARLLVRHVHQELLDSVKADIAQQEGKTPSETTLAELVVARTWMFSEHSYHIDTTHLASTVRAARVLDDEPHLRLGIDLTEYGRRLAKQFQYEGDPPFGDMYPSHQLYLSALVNENTDEAKRYFRQQAEAIDTAEFGTVAVEVYIDLLARMGCFEEAIQATLALVPDDVQTCGLAPSLLELSQKASQFETLLQVCRQRGDVLGYVTSLLHSEMVQPGQPT